MSNYCITGCSQMNPSHVCWRPQCSHLYHSGDIQYAASLGDASVMVNSAAPQSASSWSYELTPYASLYAGGASGYDPPMPKMPYTVSYTWRKDARQFGVQIDFGNYKTK